MRRTRNLNLGLNFSNEQKNSVPIYFSEKNLVYQLSINLLFTSIYAATPGAGNGGIDLVIILASPGLLTFLVYLLKASLERLRNCGNRTAFSKQLLKIPVITLKRTDGPFVEFYLFIESGNIFNKATCYY